MTVKQKQLLLCFFECLPVSGVDGIWGPQSEAATRKLQKKLGIPQTGIFDQNLEGEVINALEKEMVSGENPDTGNSDDDWWDEIEYFKMEEFACKCGKYCNGYPHRIQPQLVRIADRARKHFGKPITIVSGLRCQQHNKNVGGVENSQHLYGEAADIYVSGISQQTVLRWFLGQEDVRYAYAIENSSNVHFDISQTGR